MKKRSLTLVLLSGLALVSYGCDPFWMAAGAVAGYAASRDSVAMDLDHSWDHLWRVVLEESRSTGFVKRENSKRGRVDVRIQDSDVVITLKQLTPSTVRVVVRARKHLLPHAEVAQRVAVNILQRAKKPGQLF